MKRQRLTTALLASALTLAPLASALADRDPSAEERNQIEASLRSAGYTSWEEIEWDDERWEIDDARTADGRKFDLKLDQALTITQTERDD